ncbi:MAG: DUF2442 domain-containing protein [Chitinophagaceae bacterium]|nr:DUF2442 domain-containing protein [Chitinophagaceae bacterium]MBL0183932.1 DUF2442 domain-containing protein [Chitinophagaceae bacterium]
MIATHNIEAISFEQNLICLKVDGQVIKLPLSKVSKKLELANDIQRNLYTISPSGYGIHWPLIDEDLSIDSLLKNI